MSLFEKTKTEKRNYVVATLVGFIGGIVSAIVKWGTEIPFPPRTPDRMTPPYVMLQKMGVNVEPMTYVFSDITINYGNVIVHLSFSIFFAILYCVLAEIYPKIKWGLGFGFAMVICVIFHVFMLPMMGLTPPATQLPFDEYFSEVFGHWMWFLAIEVIRRDFRNRITNETDPEY